MSKIGKLSIRDADLTLTFLDRPVLFVPATLAIPLQPALVPSTSTVASSFEQEFREEGMSERTSENASLERIATTPSAVRWDPKKSARHFLAGGLGGMTGAVLTAPLDVVKVRLLSLRSFDDDDADADASNHRRDCRVICSGKLQSRQ